MVFWSSLHGIPFVTAISNTDSSRFTKAILPSVRIFNASRSWRYLDSKSSQVSIGETVVDPDCRFTLLELAVVELAVPKAELISCTVLVAAEAVLAFSVALLCFSLASLMSSLAASILSSGLEVVPGDGVEDAGPASHSSSMVAAPELTDLKQYSLLAGAPSLQHYHGQN